MRIGEASKNVGVVPMTIINWERAGYIRPADRSTTGQRVYSPADVLAIQRVARERSQVRKGGK